MGGESHKIHWQQWSQTTGGDRHSKRNLRNSHVSVRLSDAAQARDVIKLMRQSLQRKSDENSDDALVLVATLYNHEHGYGGGHFFEHQEVKMRNDSIINTIFTLSPNDHILQIRDRMQAHFLTKKCQLQWWYVAGGTDPMFPNCIELDGYSSPLEDDEPDWGADHCVLESEGSYCGSSTAPRSNSTEILQQQFTWLQGNANEVQSIPKQKAPDQLKSRVARMELNRSNALMSIGGEESLTSFSGYLLKRCPNERHAWRQVFCVLTADSMWYVTRVYPCGYARHRRIKLASALLLEPTMDYPPLFRTPHSFELVSENGTTHVFRATSKGTQASWIQVLQSAIVESFENHRMEQTKLILQDEAVRYSRRILDYADLGTFGIKVARYRESCRFVQSILPSTQPVLASSGKVVKRSMEDPFANMLVYCWDLAHDLVALAPVASLSLGGHCRDIERFLATSETRDSAPPIGLFDIIIAELRSTEES